MSYLELIITFMKIGAFSFGGGYAMIPFFEKEIISHNWATLSDYSKVIAMAQIVPGPFAIDSSAYIGYIVNGLPGAIVASIALSLPAFIALVFITKFYIQFKSNNYIQMALKGVRPGVLGLLVSAVYIIGIQPLFEIEPSLFSIVFLKGLLVLLIGFALNKYVKVNPVFLIALFAVMGIVLF